MNVCCFGELLVDVTPYGVSDKGYEVFEFNPGGAPANVACALSILDKRASFIGQVGDDHFGHMLSGVLQEKRVDLEGLLFSKKYLTTLAIVSLQSDGERSFSFYRKDGADVMISTEDIFFMKIDEADVFHFGSFSMTHSPSKETTQKLVAYAKSKGKKISFDVNLRELLWSDLSIAYQEIIKVLPYVDILKVSEEELEFLSKSTNHDESVKKLSATYGVPLILVTYGSKGSAVYFKDEFIHVESFKVDAIDATGAGDAFYGTFLSLLLDKIDQFDEVNVEQLTDMVRFANGAGALATLKKGAIGSLPTRSSIQSFIDGKVV